MVARAGVDRRGVARRQGRALDRRRGDGSGGRDVRFGRSLAGAHARRRGGPLLPATGAGRRRRVVPRPGRTDHAGIPGAHQADLLVSGRPTGPRSARSPHRSGPVTLADVPDESTQSISIAADPADIMAVIADFPNYPVWAESVKKAEVLETGPDGRARRVAFVLDAGIVRDQYELSYEWDAQERVEWTLTSGQM